MDLIDEQHHPVIPFIAGRDFLHHPTQALLKLTAVLGAGNQGTKVQRDEPATFERIRHLTSHHPLRQQLGYSGLTHTCFSDQNRIVLAAAREHLDQPADVGIPADHRIQLSFSGQSRQISTELSQCTGLFSIKRCACSWSWSWSCRRRRCRWDHRVWLPPPRGHHASLHRLGRRLRGTRLQQQAFQLLDIEPLATHQGSPNPLVARQTQQHVGGLDAERTSSQALLFRLIEQQLQIFTHVKRCARAGWLPGAEILEVIAKILTTEAQLLQERPQASLLQQREHQVLNIQIAMAPALGFILGCKQEIPSQLTEAPWIGGEAEAQIRRPHRHGSSFGSIPPCSHRGLPRKRSRWSHASSDLARVPPCRPDH